MTALPTPGQTVGPFFSFALEVDGGAALVPEDHPDAVRLHGRVVDGAGDPVPDALLELWQADPAGRPVQQPGSLRRDGSTFTGWGRCCTGADGGYAFTTLRPGPHRAGAPAFFALTVLARGLLDGLHTRAYLPDDAGALAADAFLASVPAERRRTLVAEASATGYAFDVRLQGEAETVFLARPRHWAP